MASTVVVSGCFISRQCKVSTLRREKGTGERAFPPPPAFFCLFPRIPFQPPKKRRGRPPFRRRGGGGGGGPFLGGIPLRRKRMGNSPHVRYRASPASAALLSSPLAAVSEGSYTRHTRYLYKAYSIAPKREGSGGGKYFLGRILFRAGNGNPLLFSGALFSPSRVGSGGGGERKRRVSN